MLKDYIVKALYLKVSKGTPDIEKPQLHFKLEQEADVNEMRYYADLYAVQFHYNPDQWLFFEDVLKVIPLEEVNTESFLRKKKKKIMFEDDNFIYFVNITDFMLKDAISPLSFEKERRRAPPRRCKPNCLYYNSPITAVRSRRSSLRR